MKLAELTWPDVAALDRDTPVISPVVALEQHGRHMPVFTDSMGDAGLERILPLFPRKGRACADA